MSEIRVGVVAEGTTDFVVIKAALAAILNSSLTVDPLQPQETRPDLGEGWCGVLKWCQEFHARGFSPIEDDPIFPFVDLVVIQVDADVAHEHYRRCGKGIEVRATSEQLAPIPCFKPCPPADTSVEELRAVVQTWLGVSLPGPRTLLCIPSKAIDSWVGAALAPSMPALDTSDIECALSFKRRLFSLPKEQRIKKGSVKREYESRAAPAIRRRWAEVRALCPQADRFHEDVRRMLGH